MEASERAMQGAPSTPNVTFTSNLLTTTTNTNTNTNTITNTNGSQTRAPAWQPVVKHTECGQTVHPGPGGDVTIAWDPGM